MANGYLPHSEMRVFPHLSLFTSTKKWHSFSQLNGVFDRKGFHVVFKENHS